MDLVRCIKRHTATPPAPPPEAQPTAETSNQDYNWIAGLLTDHNTLSLKPQLRRKASQRTIDDFYRSAKEHFSLNRTLSSVFLIASSVRYSLVRTGTWAHAWSNRCLTRLRESG